MSKHIEHTPCTLDSIHTDVRTLNEIHSPVNDVSQSKSLMAVNAVASASMVPTIIMHVASARA